MKRNEKRYTIKVEKCFRVCSRPPALRAVIQPESVKKIQLITDGACLGNPGPGGWAAILRYGPNKKEVFGCEAHTTNNRMELTAAIEGLRTLKEKCEVEVITDSEYVKNGITQWIDGVEETQLDDVAEEARRQSRSVGRARRSGRRGTRRSGRGQRATRRTKTTTAPMNWRRSRPANSAVRADRSRI